MDSEKEYDSIDRSAMWQTLQVYGARGHLLRTVKRFYEDSKACLKIGREEMECFSVKANLRHGCVKSSWMKHNS